MRIAVNTRLLLKNRLEGIGWFTYETMKRISTWHPEHEFFFLFDRKFEEEFIFSKNVKAVVLPPQSRHPILWYIWFEFSIKRFIEKNNIDLLVSPDGYIPLKTKIPTLAVIHDINFFHYPKDLPPFARLYFNFYFPKFAKNASRIATVSNYSKGDICKSYKIDLSKIDVVFNGANEQYKPLIESEIQQVRMKVSNGLPYFVFVGAFNPRKNIERLLLAFDKFKEATKSSIKLVIVGEKMYGTSGMMNILKEMRYKNDVIFTGRLQVEELKKVIGSAIAMTYFSYFEGFGIPLLEAMKCGIPLAVSNCTSIPEVVDNAAVYADPFNVDSITKSMIEIYTNEQLRDTLKHNSIQQAHKFSWDNTARALYISMLETIKGNA